MLGGERAGGGWGGGGGWGYYWKSSKINVINFPLVTWRSQVETVSYLALAAAEVANLALPSSRSGQYV